VNYAPVSIAGDTVLITITNTDNVPMYAVVTNYFYITTFDQLGPDSNNTYSGNYSYTRTGANTGTINTVKTSPAQVAGEMGTNILTFNSLTNGSVVHTWPKGGGGYGVQFGTIQISLPRTPLVIQVSDGSMGFVSNKFGFNFGGQSGQVVVVEVSTNLLNWLPLQTNTLGSAPLYFNDPGSSNFNRRFYRGRSQ
jgi:hypothetical protein